RHACVRTRCGDRWAWTAHPRRWPGGVSAPAARPHRLRSPPRAAAPPPSSRVRVLAFHGARTGPIRTLDAPPLGAHEACLTTGLVHGAGPRGRVRRVAARGCASIFSGARASPRASVRAAARRATGATHEDRRGFGGARRPPLPHTFAMPKVRAAKETPHPLVQALLAHLPEGGGLQQRTFVLASSAEAAGALRDAVASERAALLGARFVAPAAFAREVLWLLGAPAAQEQLLPLAERALLRGVLESARSEVARYALRHRASLGALVAACREWIRAGSPEPSGQLSSWGRQTLEIARAFAHALEAHPVANRA